MNIHLFWEIFGQRLDLLETKGRHDQKQVPSQLSGYYHEAHPSFAKKVPLNFRY